MENAYIAFANDSLGPAIEVYPLSTKLEQGLGNAPVEFGYEIKPSYPSGIHVAIKTPLSAEEVIAIGEREGWRSLSCNRGGAFSVIELWIENQFLLELITPDKEKEAIEFHNSQSWARAIGIKLSIQLL